LDPLINSGGLERHKEGDTEWERDKDMVSVSYTKVELVFMQ